MKKFETINLEVANRTATITLNRPDAANGLNLEMATELALVANDVASDTSLKVVILTGAGRFFCAGGDVKSMYDAEENPGAAVGEIAEQLHRAIATFARMDVPLICAVNGVAAGAGFSLAISADMVVAADSAKLTMAYSNIGLSPDGSASYYLPKLIGLRKAQELMFTNTVLTASDAYDIGLINKVVGSADLMEAASEMAQRFVVGSRSSNGAIKKLLLAGERNTLEEQMELEGRTIHDCANGKDGREGVKSFIEKRKPEFG